MRTSTALFGFATSSLFSVACAPAIHEGGSIDISSHGVDTWRGLSLQGERLHLVAEGRGILEIDLEGTLVGERKVGEAGLMDAAYRDVAVVDVGLADAPKYVLLADDQGFLYDPIAQTETVHFCVLPGDGVDTMLTQKNDAVAVTGETILASPRFYDDASNGLVSAELRTYRLTDGEPIDSVALENALELRGIAVTLDGILGVSGNTVHHLDAQGSVLGSTAIVDLGSAAGIAVDVAGGRAFILDEDNDRISVLSVADL
jgi:DNA-binding beta-propeller fold protein YncE